MIDMGRIDQLGGVQSIEVEIEQIDPRQEEQMLQPYTKVWTCTYLAMETPEKPLRTKAVSAGPRLLQGLYVLRTLGIDG